MAQHELWMRGKKRIHDSEVFFLQQTACCIHQTSVWLEQLAGSGQNGSLLLCEFRQALWRLAKLEVWIAAQRSQTATRRIH